MDTPVWRNKIGVVSQQVKLFNTTILENIALREKPEVQGVFNFCKETGIDVFINEFQQGYATVVNENSTNLSGGQQQLIALARALYKKPQVLLLDEATAAMDRRTEQFVLQLLDKLKENMIIILVTHRIQVARRSDKIYIIENRQVTASGTHEELLSQNELYRVSFEAVTVS